MTVVRRIGRVLKSAIDWATGVYPEVSNVGRADSPARRPGATPAPDDPVARARRERQLLFQGSAAAKGITTPEAYGAAYLAASLGGAAWGNLRQMSFSSVDDEVAIADAVRSIVSIATKLDEIDKLLLAATGGKGKTAGTLKREASLPNDANYFHIYANNRQSILAGELRGRTGADGDWFRQTIDLRGKLLKSLFQGLPELERILEKARWMLAAQNTPGFDEHLHLIDPTEGRAEIVAASELVAALAEAVEQSYYTLAPARPPSPFDPYH